MDRHHDREGAARMKVALVHDWLTGMRGGEKVLERLAMMFPDAPIFTLIWNRGSVSAAIESHPITTSFLQHLPDAGRRYRWFLPLYPRAIESLALPPVDLVISTSHAAAKSVIAPAGAFHLSYLHTPMRYIWELEEEYFPRDRFPWPLSWYVRATCARLRRWDVATASRPDAMLANSRHVAARILRHYGREATVVYPPVDVARFVPGRGARDYDLLAGAMAPYKNGELAIAACARLGRRLVVVGTGPEERKLRALAGPGVEFHGWVSDDEMAHLYAGARALLFPGEEDFGIIPVEAMASGCPVVALARGGALETVGRGADAADLERAAGGGVAVVPGGALFGNPTVEGLIAGIQALEADPRAPAALRAAAEPFAAERFDREFRVELERARAARPDLSVSKAGLP
jgi:glycosyltransferase involved in cell wall biosynthesis